MFEDALDEEALLRAERTRQWSAPVWDTAIKGDLQALVVLAARGHPVDAPHPKHGITPLWAAAENGHAAVVRFLTTTMGVQVNSHADDGSTALFAAAQSGNAEVVAALLECRGVLVDLERHHDAATPLYIASQCAHLPVVQLLLAAGADPNRQRKGGYTPLFTACNRGHAAVVELFIATSVTFGARSCDFSLANDAGVRPAAAAKRAGHKHLARLVDRTARFQADDRRRRAVRAKAAEAAEASRAAAGAEPVGKARQGDQGQPSSPRARHKRDVRWDDDALLDIAEGAEAGGGGGASGSSEEGGTDGAANKSGDDGAAHASDTALVLSGASAGEEPSGGEEGQGDGDAVVAEASRALASHVVRRTRKAPEDRGITDTIFVYSEDKEWDWEWYIKMSAMHTHNVVKCARRGEGGCAAACSWWRLQAHLTALEPCQVGTALFAQVAGLHALAHDRAAAGRGGLLLTQCLFSEARGFEGSRRCHTLELRLTHGRGKRARSAQGGYTDPGLVRRDEVS